MPKLPSRTRRRLALVGALVAAAPVVGGSPGALLAIVAGLVALDSVVPMPGVTSSEAQDRFARMQRARRRGRGRLEVLDDRAGWAASAARRDLGVQPIALASVVGTVEPAKAKTFDRAFRPGRGSAEHWKRLWLAQRHGAPMPPISVYRVGDAHYVRDGHHRVSVARDLGLTAIDAEVVELTGPRISSRSPAGPSSRARGTRPPAPRSASRTATAAPSRAPAPPPRPR